MKILIQTFLFFFFLNSVFAQQEHICQTDQAPILERLIQNKEFLKTKGLSERKADYYIPVVIHIISDTEGRGSVTDLEAYEQLCQVNRDFSEGGFIFYLKEPFNKMNNGALHNDFIGSSTGGIVNAMLRDSAINIFIVKNVSTQGIPAVTSQRFIAVSNREVQDLSYFLSHEMGHFFSLIHTNHGWLTPFASWTKAPSTDELNQPTEYQDGTNCDVGGDKICDTPPDYFPVPPATCDYSGGVMDPSCTAIDPMENNMMGVYMDCQPHEFTPNQFEVIEADYLTFRKDFLRFNYTPVAIGAPDQPIGISPLDGTFPITNGQLIFDWEATANAVDYVFEISTNQFFNPVLQTFSTTESDGLVENLEPNRKYFWRVTGISETGCSSISDDFSFETNASSSVSNLELKGNILSVFPNPISNAQPIRGKLKAKESFPTILEIYQLDGKLVFQQPYQFKTGVNSFSIPSERLSAGISILKIKTPEGTLVEKVILK